MPIPLRIDSMPIPEIQTLDEAWRKTLVLWLSDLATSAIDYSVNRAALGSSYGCINVEFELETLRRAQAWLDDRIEELRTELKLELEDEEHAPECTVVFNSECSCGLDARIDPGGN